MPTEQCVLYIILFPWEQKTKHAGSDSPSRAVLPAPAATVLETFDRSTRCSSASSSWLSILILVVFPLF